MRKAGLTNKEAKEKLLEFGPNLIPTEEKFSLFRLFLSQFANFLIVILLLAAGLSFFLGDFLDGSFILTVALLNSLFGFFQEFRAHRSIVALKSLLMPQVRVIRDNEEVVISALDLVPGDLVILNEGEKIPADGKLIFGTHLEVDEAILTGESIPILKQVGGESRLLMGTTIVSGRGKMIIDKTGLETEFGKIAQSLTEIKEEKTPLQVQLSDLGKKLGLGILVLCILIVLVGIWQGREFFSILLTSISTAVAAIPEGLPAVVTIALALGMEKMARKKAIMKKLVAIETLGAIQVLLIDKTGTLTQNQMRVRKVWHLEKKIPEGMLRAAILGNSASLLKKENGFYEAIGDKTDVALLLWAREQLGLSFESFQSEGKVIDEYAFDPISKSITIIFEKNKRKCILVRGAPEKILEQTNLTTNERTKITSEFEKYAQEGLRVIGFGFKEEKEKYLTFLGFVGIDDPPRPEAREAVRLAREAGIRTVMVTGDNEITAESIAREVGLIEKNEDIITGENLEKMTEEELETVLLKTRIFARVKPQDKLRLTEAFQKKGFVVGVTGDGVNDALALKRANVGVAMGETGTDVAKEAADMVITDDNFMTIIKAIEEGRTIYNNIIKSVAYLLSCNLAEIGTIFLAMLLGLPLPLLPVQILWMNLVTDSLPALALASDTKDPLILKKLPRSTNSHILNNQTLKFLIVSGLIMTALALTSFYFGLKIVNESAARTIVFTFLVILQMVQAFAVRGFKNPMSNKFLIMSVGIILILQFLILVVPGLQAIFH